MDRTGDIGGQAIARIFEEARYTLRRRLDHPQAHDPDIGFVLARVRMDILEPVRYPGEVEVAVAVGRVGRTSFDYVSAMFQDGRCVAVSDATVAVRSRMAGAGCVLEPSFREAMAHVALGTMAPAPG
jgi:acyl-CoA thioester hydrolase